MLQEDLEIIKKKAHHYCESEEEVHIKLKVGIFKEGHIINVKKDQLILNSEDQGEHPVYFAEIKFLDKRRMGVQN